MSNKPSFAYLKISGSPFEAGQALGRFGAQAVHEHLLHSKAWAGVMGWRGSERVARMAALVQARFPRVWSELQGLASGLQLPLGDVFLWNCRGDLWAMSPDGCTTVQIPGSGVQRISHNEDGDPGFTGRCAMAEFAVDDSPGFASFVYPGSIPGHTFAVTQQGLAITVNNLRELSVDAGMPRMVLTRALLELATQDEVVRLLQAQPRAGGFHLSVAQRGCAHLLSIEFSSAACSVRTVEAPALHANHAIHPAMQGFPQLITESSRRRQLRGDALLAQAIEGGSAIQPLNILADAQDPAFPIYRKDPADSDDENTQATADIVVRDTHVDWLVYERPQDPPRFRMTDGHAQSPL
ncbi:C45 family autoproteolytic acyltransferase/hydolase [Polaromonas jejuensis]|uniref:C45 family autoproteolytic acyltransferase/hydrolase n=1 Tax=Polaromonas jejuensis TaxID=457502 RepID=A0ABW0Q3R7_9BURK|nr:C45 family peptidase [Polaromonas jejuensis]